MGVQFDCSSEVSFRRLGLVSVEVVQSLLQRAGWHVDVVLKHPDEVASGCCSRIHPVPQNPGRVDAHLAHWVVQQSAERGVDPGIAPSRERVQRASGRASEQGVGTGEIAEQGVGNLGIACPRMDQLGGDRLPERRCFLAQQAQEVVGGIVRALPGLGDRACALPRRPVHSRAVPFLDRRERPVGVLVGVTTVAGVRDAVFLCQQRVGDGEPVVATGIALHIGRLRHVAVYALAARAVQRVMRMRRRVNFWAVGIRAGVAAHAERIARLQGLAGMRLMAVDAAHAGVVHLAAEERGQHIILPADLAVGIVDVRLVRDDVREVVEVPVARLEIARQLSTA